MNKFERVAKFPDAILPQRATVGSAGYDLYIAEDFVLPAWKDNSHIYEWTENVGHNFGIPNMAIPAKTLEETKEALQKTNAKPYLVSTGLKCQVKDGYFLSIVARSSTPLKYNITVANSIGVVDSDYYNNEGNEGEIFLQLYNFNDFPIQLKKGDCIAQGIFIPYDMIENDEAEDTRKGGYGSTSK